MPWVSVTATGDREALDQARMAIAEWLDVPTDAFDLGVDPLNDRWGALRPRRPQPR